MHHFEHRQGVLHAEDVALPQLAREVGTPAYVYSRATLTRHLRVMEEALAGRPHLICYAVKAASNLAVLEVLARLGAGFDIVSGGELARVQRAGGDLSKVVFSGVGKTAAEMEAGLRAGVRIFNVESEPELELLNEVALGLGVRARMSLRVNPDVDPRTHPYISTGLTSHKFGVPMDEARRLYGRAAGLPGLEVRGVDCHIGSQITELSPFLDALERVKALLLELRRDGLAIDHLDLGGGLGVPYGDERPPTPAEWGLAIRDALADLPDVTLIVEPGRVVAGNAAVLLTRVLYVKRGKTRTFVVVDAAMNDLLRPTLYEAWHEVRPVEEPAPGAATFTADVVGPVCETGDFLARDRLMAEVRQGDLLAVMTAGAYGFSMSSNYNSRPRPPEILVDGARWHLVRARETVDDLVRGERLIPPD